MAKSKSDYTRLVTELPKYMYKLNENSESKERIVSRIKITGNWSTYDKEVEGLKPFVRTLSKKTGFIDMKKVIPHNNQILWESWKSETYNLEKE